MRDQADDHTLRDSKTFAPKIFELLNFKIFLIFLGPDDVFTTYINLIISYNVNYKLANLFYWILNIIAYNVDYKEHIIRSLVWWSR